MGVCRTGRFLSSDYLAIGCKPDIVILGKSITGGVYPASYILGRDEIMNIVGTREIVQTFAFSPMAIAATTAVLQIVDDESLAEKAMKLGSMFMDRSKNSKWEAFSFVDFVTARGAEFSIVFEKGSSGSCQAVGSFCMQCGLLMFPKENHLRMSVPLVISEATFAQALDILGDALHEHASNEGPNVLCASREVRLRSVL